MRATKLLERPILLTRSANCLRLRGLRKPPWMDYTPSSISDDFSHTNAVVTEVSRTAIFISGHDGPATGLSPVTLGVDVIGSRLGDTGSSTF